MNSYELQVEKIIEEKDMKNVDVIIKKYHPLLVSSIRRYYNKPHEFDELYDEGILEICEALKDYEKSKNSSFGGYLKSRLYYFYLGKNNLQEILSLDKPLGEENDISLMDILEDEQDIQEDYNRSLEYGSLYDSLKILTKRQKNILLDFYINGLSIQQIAEKYHIKYRTAFNTKKTALEKLKKYLMDSGNFS